MNRTTQRELSKADASAELTPEARTVHRHLLARFADTGEAPRRVDLDEFARTAGMGPAVVEELAEHDLVVFDEVGELRAAYPFSPTPTEITVTWAEGPTVYSMCAIDALGMSRMLDRPVIITATEPETGEVVIVEVDQDQAVWTPETAVVFDGTTSETCCPSADRSCGNINFFTTARAAHTWAAKHPQVSGTTLGQQAALQDAITEFGEMLR